MVRAEMSMTISLITSFTFPGKRDEFFVLSEGMEKIGDLIGYLGRELDYSLLGPKGDEIDDDLVVSINGKRLWVYPEGLNTVLHEGDKVEIFMLTLGGG